MTPLPNLPERKRRQLTDKVASLKNATMSEWLKDSQQDGVFQIHNSQMTVVGATMDTLCRIIDDNASQATPADVQTVETAILIAFQVWEFFRSKLAQRLENQLQPFLRICDELAWKCYEPLRIAAGSDAATKEPPLVFLDSDWSPFVVERKKAMQIGAVPRSTLEDFGFDQAVAQMPFAVIGLPWYQRNHLPDALVVCHEVGHAVELDFGLGEDLDRILETAVTDTYHQMTWKAWRREIFADTFGCIAAGPSFVWALADALLADRARIVALHETYPSDYLRILYNVEVLRRMPGSDLAGSKIAPEAARIEAWWRQMYETGGHILKDFEDDLGRVAAGILGWTPKVFGGKSLTSILKFGNLQQIEAENEASKVLDLEALKLGDIRVGFAACRIAFATDPARFNVVTKPAAISPQQHLQNHLATKVCKNDFRGRPDDVKDKSRLNHVRVTATELGRQLLKIRASEPESSPTPTAGT